MEIINGIVLSVSISESHSFTKYRTEKIHLLEGLGVEGDAHCGKNVQHLSRIAKDPRRPNLRQITSFMQNSLTNWLTPALSLHPVCWEKI